MRTAKIPAIGRRTVLRGLAGTSFAATSMRFFLRTAEGATFPKRFLFVFTNAGRDSESHCTGTGPGYTLGAGYAPLEPFKSKVSILDGMKLPPHTGEEHPCGKASVLTGRMAADKTWKSTGLSFDRYLAGKLTAGSSFFTGTYNGKGSGDQGVNPVSWNGANSANDAFLQGSSSLVKKLFAGAASLPPAPTTPTPPSTGTPTPIGPSAQELNDTALYDYLMNEVKRIKSFAPQSQVEKLELHAQTISQLKSSIVKTPTSGTPGGGGGSPSVPSGSVTRTCGDTVDLASASMETDKVSLAIANAFACDRARIGVVRFGSEDPYHDYSHWQDGADNRTNMRRMDKEYAQNFANLLGYLDSFKEGDKTVLDNTVVLWSHDCCGQYGVDMDSGTPLPGEDNGANGIHNTGYVPFVMAGSLGGTLKAGQRFVIPGRSNVELYRTIAAQMGVDASDFGDSAYYKGLIQDLIA